VTAADVEFTSFDGLVLRGNSLGEPDADPVLLLHGGGQTLRSWRGAARKLADAGYRAISVDLRAHGSSDWSPEARYALSDFAQDVRAVVEAIGRPTALVGASLGGLSAMLAVGEPPPAPCRALVLVDVGPQMSSDGRERIHAFMAANPEGFATLDEAADAVSRYLTHRPRPDNVEGLRHNLRLGEDGRYRWHWDPRYMAEGRVRTDADDVVRLEAAVREITCPMQMMRGSESDVVSAEHVAALAALAPDCEFATIEGARHMVAGDDNDKFTLTLIDFLQRRAPVGAVR
jgi:non-heme chloroperoxidase